MNKDTITQFIKAEVSRYDDEISRNAQARLLAQHASLVTAAAAPWLTEVSPEYNRSETKLIQERWKYHHDGGNIPELLPVDEELDLRVKEASEVLTRLGEATEIDYDYVENLLEPLTGQSEYRYWIARTLVHTPIFVEDAPAPASPAYAHAPTPAPVVVAPVIAPLARPIVPLTPPGSPMAAPLVRVAPLVPPSPPASAFVAPVVEAADVAIAAVEALIGEQEFIAAVEPAVAEAVFVDESEEPDVAPAEPSSHDVAAASRAVVPVTTRIATSSRPVVEDYIFRVDSAE